MLDTYNDSQARLGWLLIMYTNTICKHIYTECQSSKNGPAINMQYKQRVWIQNPSKMHIQNYTLSIL